MLKKFKKMFQIKQNRIKQNRIKQDKMKQNKMKQNKMKQNKMKQNKMNDNDKHCFVLTHLYTGDFFTNYAMLSHLSHKYIKVHILCLYRNRYTITQMFQDNPNICIYILDSNINSFRVNANTINHFSKMITKKYKCRLHILYTGLYNNKINMDIFWRDFYTDAKLPYEIRFENKYMNIPRNEQVENELYQQLILKYTNEYIFLHDHRNYFYNHLAKRDNIYVLSKYNIFHPNFNYYNEVEDNEMKDNEMKDNEIKDNEMKDNEIKDKKNLWDSTFYRDNLFDYGKIIENAIEIHITDSSFSCLVQYLDLSKVKKKILHTNFNYIDYNPIFKDWTIIKR